MKKVILFSIILSAITGIAQAQKIGLLTNLPQAPVHIASSGQVNTTGGLLLLGDRNEGNLQLDFNVIQSMYGANPLNLAIQPQGGRVGINTDAPFAPLHVATSGQVNIPSGAVIIGSMDDGRLKLDFNTIQSSFGASSTLNLALQPEGGRVGVNTTNPSAALHVYSPGIINATNGLFQLGSAANGHLVMDYDVIQARSGVSSTNTLRLQSAGGNLNIGSGDLFWDDATSRLGILDVTPEYSLDVNGSIGAGEFLYHKGEFDTYFRFNTNRLRANAGGITFLDMFEGTQDYIDIGNGSNINVNVNDGMFMAGVNRQVGIGDNFILPTARLHIKADPTEPSFLVERNAVKQIEFQADGDIQIGEPTEDAPRKFLSYHPGEFSTEYSQLPIALRVVGVDLSDNGTAIEGGEFSIGNTAYPQLRFDNDEMQGVDGITDIARPIKINSHGGNVIIGHMGNAKVGINVLSALPESDLHVQQSIQSSSNQSGIRLSSNDFYDWRIAINGSRDLEFYNDDNTLRATLNHTTGLWSAPSDIRLKKNIDDLGPVLDKIAKMHAVTYQMNEQEASEPITNGFIAQEVQKIFPEIVFERNGTLAVSYEQFSVLALAAIKELNAKNEKLESRLNNLETRMTKMEKE